MSPPTPVAATSIRFERRKDRLILRQRFGTVGVAAWPAQRLAVRTKQIAPLVEAFEEPQLALTNLPVNRINAHGAYAHKNFIGVRSWLGQLTQMPPARAPPRNKPGP